MAETENRKPQDIGQDEAYIVNLKQAVENAQDVAGRNRVLFDALATNMVATLGAINAQILAHVKQGVTVTAKQDENTIGINETDHVAAQILNSPWAEALKAIMTTAVAEAQKQS
jgi:hypothetical protein